MDEGNAQAWRSINGGSKPREKWIAHRHYSEDRLGKRPRAHDDGEMMRRSLRHLLVALVLAPAALLAFSGLALAQSESRVPMPSAPAAASTQDISGVWLGDGGNNR